MMYDIYLDPTIGRWRIRMVYFSWFYTTRTKEVNITSSDGSEMTTGPLYFGTFSEAEAHAVAVGLDRAYTRRYPKRVVTYVEVLHATANPTHAHYST